MTRFTTRTLLTAISVTAILIAWLFDHYRLVDERDLVVNKLRAEMQRNLIASQSWKQRRAEVAAIAKGEKPADIPLLLFALSDPDTIVRESAFNALSSIRFDTTEARDGFYHPDAQAEAWFWTDVILHAREKNDDRPMYGVRWSRK